MKTVQALVITGFGINCEEEMAAAYRLAGAEARIVHVNDILVDGFSIHDFDVVNFPGGFSFGDDIASGKVMANKVKYKQLPSGKTFLAELQQFLADGKYILGICNGFQMLVKMGLLPDWQGAAAQEVTLTGNDSGQFENRWCHCAVLPEVHTPFLQGIERLYLPVRHGEGKLVFQDEAMRQAIVSKNLNCLSYCEPDGTPADQYPLNPNGSELQCAGLTNASGQILGMMPHPEAFLSLYNHPNWGQLRRQYPDISEEGEGLRIFKNIVRHIVQRV